MAGFKASSLRVRALIITTLFLISALAYTALFKVDMKNKLDDGRSTLTVSDVSINSTDGYVDDYEPGTLIKGPGYGRSNNPGGTLEWSYMTGGLISTPALADLNDDGRLEIIFATTNDQVICLNNVGEFQWVYSMQIEPSYAGPMCDFQPPQFFSSVTVDDLDLDGIPEILVGGMGALHCITNTGVQKWVHNANANYYATPSTADTNDDGYPEILAASDNPGGGMFSYSYLESLWYNGLPMWSYSFSGGEPPFVISSPCVDDIDGENETERYMEISVGQHDYLFNIFNYQGQMILQEGGMQAHESYVTHAMANITGDKRLEIISGTGESVSGVYGNLQCINQDKELVWEFPTDRIVVSAVALGDINADGTFEALFGCDDGNIYMLNCDDGSEIWHYETGDKVQSSPAIFDIGNDKILEFAVGSDDGNVYCFDSDGNLLWTYNIGVPIGIASPVVSDIDYDNQLELVIGATDGKLYCISVGGNATVGQTDWPTFHHGNNHTGIYNQTFKHSIGLIPTNESDPGWHPGVTPPQEGKYEKALWQYVEPGEVAKYYLQVWNLGAKNDTINLEITPPADNWSAWLSMNTTENLEPGSYKIAVLNVQAPVNARPKETCYVKVRARSTLDEDVSVDIDTYTIVNLTIDFKLEITGGANIETDADGKKRVKMPAGSMIQVNVRVENIGSLNDTYDLSIDDGSSIWETTFENGYDNATFSLLNRRYPAEEKVKNMKFVVRSPPNAMAGDKITVRVEGTSRKYYEVFNAELMRFDEIEVVISENSSLLLTADVTEGHADPGKSVRYNIVALNRGNSMLTVTVEMHGNVEVATEPYEYTWTANLMPMAFSLNPQEQKAVTLDVYVPYKAAGGEKTTLYVAAWAPDPGGQGRIDSNALVFITTANTISKFNVTTEQDEFSVEPGGTVSFDVGVVNEGNGEASASFDVGFAENEWDVEFQSSDGYTIHEVDLDMFESTTVTVLVKVPSDFEAGNYSVDINISWPGGYVIVPVKVSVSMYHDVVVNVTSSTVVADPGTSLSYLITITNLGNGKDVVVMEMDEIFTSGGSKAGDWPRYIYSISNSRTPELTIETNFTETLDITKYVEKVKVLGARDDVRSMNILLGRGQTVYVETSFYVPFEANKGIYRTYFSAKPVAGGDRTPGNNKVSMEVQIKLSDLAIRNIYIPSDLKEGEITTISVEIANDGYIAASDVVLELYIDGKQVGKTTFKRIPEQNGTMLATFTWRATPGKHTLMTVVDPYNTIKEENGDIARGKKYRVGDEKWSNNVLTKEVTVEGSLLSQLLNTEGVRYILPPILLIIILSIIIILYFRTVGKGRASPFQPSKPSRKKKAKRGRGEGGEKGGDIGGGKGGNKGGGKGGGKEAPKGESGAKNTKEVSKK